MAGPRMVPERTRAGRGISPGGTCSLSLRLAGAIRRLRHRDLARDLARAETALDWK